MKRFMLTAMHSNAGKTVMTCALLAALKRRGIEVHSFKCGPDYIDPMFHSRVLGIPCRNLDLFLQGKEKVKETLSAHGGELAVLEGAMGYYDGMAGTEENSAWEVAALTETPAVLVVRPKGVGISLAAQIRGMMQFRADSNRNGAACLKKGTAGGAAMPYAENSGIGGILLADCSASLAAYLRPILERETGLPVFGYLPAMKEAELGSRHLGLMTADEIRDLSDRMTVLAEQAEKSIDIDGILHLADMAGTIESEPAGNPGSTAGTHTESTDVPQAYAAKPVCRIAVARDAAFCFLYEDSLDALRRAGAELVFFSPLTDGQLPENVQGLYLCGGYPELYAEELSWNSSMLQSIRKNIKDGMPVLAECGGFLYLQQELEDEQGKVWPLCGVLPGNGFRTKCLQRFGYHWLQAEKDSMLFRTGEKVPVHEFHYWDCTCNGTDLTSVKPDGRQWACGYADESMYAAFPHLHLGGALPLAERFVQRCRKKD
ncbi:MAG: cobyrinate a,c-diamide synthase [Eubacterium sp.]|nr:cobyrinate a,c-diamide synthase [Eubacterium sp.]